MKQKNFSMINCISTALLAFFFTVPLHEFFHLATFLLNGDKVIYFTSGSVYAAEANYALLPPLQRILVAGGSASILNAIIGIILLIVLLKVEKMPSMLRLFLTMLMGGHLLEGFGYFLIGGIFAAGDWGNVFSYFQDSPGTVTAMRIILAVIGAVSAVAILYIATRMTYQFIENPIDKEERKYVSLRVNLVLFLTAFIVGAVASISLPSVRSGEHSYWMFFIYNSMWFIYLVAFFYAWGGIMVKPAKAAPFRCKLPEKPYPVVWVIAVALTLVDIFVFGPGIYF